MAKDFDPTLMGPNRAKPKEKVTLVDESDPLSTLMPKPEPGPAVDWMAEPGQELPPDVMEIWRSEDERALVRALVSIWGVEKFRSSDLHIQAAEQIRAERRLAASRLGQLRGLQSEGMFLPVESPLEPFKAKKKPKSRGRSETCVHRVPAGSFCKLGCD